MLITQPVPRTAAEVEAAAARLRTAAKAIRRLCNADDELVPTKAALRSEARIRDALARNLELVAND